MDKTIIERQIKDALGAHGMWKLKLKTAVATGNLPKPAADIATDNQCSFGKWLYGMQGDADIMQMSAYKDVKTAHAEFHRQAGRVAKLVEDGDQAGAERELDGHAYRSATDRLNAAMADWRRAL